jgi:putative ABC transport system permease protein
MKIADIFEETYFALSANKARSGLTILGIVIGIASVITLISIGQGASGSIQSNIQSIGSNLIIVSPGTQRGPGVTVSSGRGSAKSLKLTDAQAIAQEISNVKAVAAEVSGRYQVTAKGQNTNASVDGTVPDYTTVRNLEIENGSFLSQQNVDNASKVAVIGPSVRDDLFGEDADPVGQTIKINKIQFQIIGLTKVKGGAGFGSQDNTIFIPVSTAQKFLSGNEYVTSINVAAQDAESTTIVQQDITDLLLERHNIVDSASADFSTMNQSDILASATSITQTLTMLLGAVAGISLVVGGIGIMNMMLTTVTERTREIGLRKAIGAKKKDINIQFFVEAISLTFLGGLIGVAAGWLAAFVMSYFGIIQASVSISSVVLAFGVSAAIGIVFGYYPARRASRLNPIEALRYE